jgi:HAE1 family hydrophobic/amphiphilic exporter-1
MKHVVKVTALWLILALGVVAQEPRPSPTPEKSPTEVGPSPTLRDSEPAQSAASIGGDRPDAKSPEETLRNSPLMSERPEPLPPLPNLKRVGVAPGDALKLSLTDAVRLALENNTNIEVARDEVRINETTLRSLEGVYDPLFTFTPGIVRSVTPTISSLAGADTHGRITDTDFTFSPSVTKQFGTGGGNYQFFYSGLRRNTDSSVNIVNPYFSSSLGLTFNQPLLRDRSIDQYRRNIRVQRKVLAQSDLDFRLQTIAVIAQVQQAYWELIFALRDQENQLDNLTLAREQLQMIEYRIANGISSPLERAEANTQIASSETALLAATNYVTVTENNLKQVMLRNPTAPEWGRKICPIDQPSEEPVSTSLPELLTSARANRPELRRFDLQQDINALDVKLFRNQTRPRIDLQANVATVGLAGTVVPAPLITGTPDSNASAFLLDQINQLRIAQGLPPAAPSPNRPVPQTVIGGFGRTLGDLAKFNTYSVAVGVNVQFPLHNTTAKANLAGAMIAAEQTSAAKQTQEQAIESDVRNAAQTVETTAQQIKSARAARISAELQLAGERQLYLTGLSTTFLVFQREDQLVTARTAEVRAQTAYSQAVANLQRAISSTLEVNRVTVETPHP